MLPPALRGVLFFFALQAELKAFLAVRAVPGQAKAAKTASERAAALRELKTVDARLAAARQAGTRKHSDKHAKYNKSAAGVARTGRFVKRHGKKEVRARNTQSKIKKRAERRGASMTAARW